MKITESAYRPIFTKWLEPTDTKCSRIKAYDGDVCTYVILYNKVERK